MEFELQKTIVVKMTSSEVEKLIDALDEIDSDSIPEWADEVIDRFYKPLKAQHAKL